MARTKQGPRGERKPRNTWTRDQRLTLQLLRNRFDSMEVRTRIFNVLFADHLRRQGFKDGITPNLISAQYNESGTTKPCSIKAWKDILQPPATAAEVAKRNTIEEQIERVASTLTGCHPAPQSIMPTTPTIPDASSSASPQGRDPGSSSQRLPPATPNRTPPADRTRSDYHSPPATRELKRKRLEKQSSFPSLRPMAASINLLHSNNDEEPSSPTSTPKRGPRRSISQWAFQPPQGTDDAIDSDSDTDFVPTLAPKPAKRLRASPEVVVPVTPKPRGRPRKDGSLVQRTHWYPRPNGGVWTSQKKYYIAMQDLAAPADADAHPPLAGLLFRYWTHDCQSKLDDNGEFVAGQFRDFPLPVPEMATPQYPEWWWTVGHHMNRNKVPSPFISTCNDLTWTLHLAVGQRKEGVRTGRLTVIDGNEINRGALFHAQAFHRELCKKMIFDNGAWHYAGKREFLVYGKIKKNAILHTFSVDDIVRLTATVPEVHSLLRLDQLATKGKGFGSTIQPAMKAQNLALNANAISAMAKVVLFLGLGAGSPTEHVLHVVSDLLQGWQVAVNFQSSDKWLEDADVFASAMCPSSGVTSKNFQRMRLAFLEGTRWSRGDDTSTRHKAESMRKMLVRAKKIGLENPVKMLCDELDASKLNLRLFGRKQQQMLEGSSTNARLIDEDDEDDTVPITPRSLGARPHDDILYNTDDE